MPRFGNPDDISQPGMVEQEVADYLAWVAELAGDGTGTAEEAVFNAMNPRAPWVGDGPAWIADAAPAKPGDEPPGEDGPPA